MKCESADAKMSYKFLTAVLGKEEKFHIPEKDINFTGRKKKPWGWNKVQTRMNGLPL